ncbi:MAG: hypothetical protein AVDCRST_MAG59-3747 [uncultured Thermomicrobiales bacterium]|uniref:Orc1-like AAA ATPase domain-containing protein n=1 Tax=uncultured Thermomicrobiales bacterium TaxID=1645740 RepID=A0A6J4VC42_9BACT|nr:MAG: hypothetical protein AVDCRST_MAG59-3747 [uncultured Thermomicrobiales bacterium]
MTDSLTASTPAAVADALPAPAGGGLPAPLTSFVGREREVAALRRLLVREGTRLVVLTGPGGVGKTRLALRAAAEAAPRFPDGVVFVPLAAVRSPLLLAPTVAEALGLVDDGRPVEARLVERLRPCRVLLLAGGLGWYWSSADHFREARDLFAAVVAMPGGEAAPAALANALTSAGDIANWMDDQDGATGFYERALALRRALGDDAAAILLVRCLGNVAIDRGDLDRAESLLTESLGLARAAGEAWEEAAAVNLLGLVAAARGDFAAALPRHAEAAAGWARLGDHGH